MDPLSIGASVIAVVGATGKLIKGIRRLKALSDAPRELDDLLAEISQFELVIQAIRNTNENSGPELKTLLKTATDILVESESLIEYHLTEAGTSNKVDRWQWTHKSKDVERLRGKLQDVTANVVALVGVNASTTIHQVAQTTNQVLAEQRQLSDQIIPKINLFFQLLEESPSTRAALNSSLGNVRQLTLQPPSRENDIVAVTNQRTICQGASAAPRIQSQSILSIAKVQKFRACDIYCACKCHFSTNLGAQGIFAKLFGHGYVKTAGFGMLRTQCDAKSCRAYAAPRVLVQYCLPKWLASRMLQMWFTSSPPCGPEFLLRVPRVMKKDNLALEALYMDDIEKMKVAITRGDCTPYDVDEYGANLLTRAACSYNWRTLHHLCTYEDFRTSSYFSSHAERLILMIVFGTPFGTPGLGQSPVLTEVMPFIDWEYHARIKSLTALHRIACGISDVSIDVELQDPTTINELDEQGHSALWFAVKNQNLTHVRKLLEQGADPNIGYPPLWMATRGPANYDNTKLLLDHGASLDPDLIPARKRGWLPWPPADGSEDSFAIDRLLISSGISINHPASRGETILMHLSSSLSWHESCSQQRLKQLISFGADLEVTDEEGMTAIMYAVTSACPEAYRFLAGAGARLDLKTVRGRTILHLAIFRTSRTYTDHNVTGLCEAMHDTDLDSVDLDAKDEDGNTAYDLLRIRNGRNCDFYYQSGGKYSWSRHHFWRNELEAIKALEKLLHHAQESQGVPEADRYPPLGEYEQGEYGRRDAEDQPVPGAWPAYGD